MMCRTNVAQSERKVSEDRYDALIGVREYKGKWTICEEDAIKGRRITSINGSGEILIEDKFGGNRKGYSSSGRTDLRELAEQTGEFRFRGGSQ